MNCREQLHPLQVNMLQDINNIAPISAADENCLADIKAVLAQHNRLSRFGIVLLHKHFRLQEGEALVEFCDHDTRTLITKPINIASMPATNLMETVWRFDGTDDEEESETVCVRYCPEDDAGRHYGYKDHETDLA